MPTGTPNNPIPFPVPPQLLVVDPAGRQTTVAVKPFPFHVGRAPDSQLVLHDSRVSRDHARFSRINGQFVIEDLDSRHGVWINGERIRGKRVLTGGERIEFGVPDGYRIHFSVDSSSTSPTPVKSASGVIPTATSLEKLQAVLDIGRSLQTSFSIPDVLDKVLDAAIAVSGAERGFLLLLAEPELSNDPDLVVRAARSRGGERLHESDLRVPRRLIQQALDSRRDMFSMSFDPVAITGDLPVGTLAELALRSVCCLPLVRVNLGGSVKPAPDTERPSSVGVLYLDSRAGTVDLANGNRELLQTFALEASTVLESARLLADERSRQQMEDELAVARRIQQGLLPRQLPNKGWLRAEGSSSPCHEVGGDYFDLVQESPDVWVMVIADVAGKGVSAALVASFLQGAFLAGAPESGIGGVLSRINEFLADRGMESRHATVFHASLDRRGLLTYANAGHCQPLVVSASGVTALEATSMPLGFVHGVRFGTETSRLNPGDMLVLYSDGVTEASNSVGELFGTERLREAVRTAADRTCSGLYSTVMARVREFIGNADQQDDLTLVVVEFSGPE